MRLNGNIFSKGCIYKLRSAARNRKRCGNMRVFDARAI